MSGWVYVITNKSMHGLVKVGYTTKDPRARAAELGNTGAPYPYVAEYGALVEAPAALEKDVHKYLSAVNLKEGKEWFRCSVEQAIAIIEEMAGSILNEFTREAFEEERHKDEERKKQLEIERHRREFREYLKQRRQEKEKERERREQRAKELRDEEEYRKCIEAIEAKRIEETKKIEEKHPDIFGYEAYYEPSFLWTYVGTCGAIVVILAISDALVGFIGLVPIAILAVLPTFVVHYVIGQSFTTLRKNSRWYRDIQTKKAELMVPVSKMFPRVERDISFVQRFPDKFRSATALMPVERRQLLSGGASVREGRFTGHISNPCDDWVVTMVVLEVPLGGYWPTFFRVPICVLPDGKADFSEAISLKENGDEWKWVIREAYGYRVNTLSLAPVGAGRCGRSEVAARPAT